MQILLLLAASLAALAETKAEFLANIEPHLPAIADRIVLTRKCQDVNVPWDAWRSQFDTDEAAMAAATKAHGRLNMARIDKDGKEHGMCTDDDADAVAEVPKMVVFSPEKETPCPVN